MAQQLGSTSTLGIGWESTYGTAVTTGFLLPFNSCSVAKTIGLTTPATLTGRRDAAAPFQDNISVSGDVVFPLDTVSLWYWLYAAFYDGTSAGYAETDDTPVASDYTHVFSVVDGQQSFTLQRGFPDTGVSEFFYADGGKISRLSFNVGTQGELVGTASIIASDETNAGSTIFSVSETAVAMGERYYMKDASIEIDTVASTRIKDMTLNIDFGLDEGQRVVGGDGALGALPQGIVGVSGSITTIFDDDQFIDIASGQTVTQMELILTPSTTAKYTCTFDMEEVLLSYASPQINGPNGVDVTFDFQAYFGSGSNDSIIQVTLVNDVEKVT